ncbi:MAG: MBL fold metallo-hydrolase [Kiloniellales bacterium]|nr:MBL fold metallo-hydrolase [Kiloniellales bacterium]
MPKAVAPSWYDVQSQRDDILRIREVHVDPYAVGDIWLVRGSRRDLVVDTGSGIVAPQPFIRSISQRPLLAVALNSFYDHAGGWHSFAERACHPLEAGNLKDPWEENETYSIYLTDARLRALPWKGYSTTRYRMAGADPTLLLRDGDLLDIGGRILQVLHVQGRSEGGLALWEEATGSLFTSDMLYDGDHGPAWPPSEPGRYLESLERFAELPVSMVYPGHYGAFGGERMHALIAEQKALLEGLA